LSLRDSQSFVRDSRVLDAVTNTIAEISDSPVQDIVVSFDTWSGDSVPNSRRLLETSLRATYAISVRSEEEADGIVVRLKGEPLSGATAVLTGKLAMEKVTQIGSVDVVFITATESTHPSGTGFSFTPGGGLELDLPTVDVQKAEDAAQQIVGMAEPITEVHPVVYVLLLICLFTPVVAFLLRRSWGDTPESNWDAPTFARPSLEFPRSSLPGQYVTGISQDIRNRDLNISYKPIDRDLQNFPDSVTPELPEGQPVQWPSRHSSFVAQRDFSDNNSEAPGRSSFGDEVIHHASSWDRPFSVSVPATMAATPPASRPPSVAGHPDLLYQLDLGPEPRSAAFRLPSQQTLPRRTLSPVQTPGAYRIVSPASTPGAHRVGRPAPSASWPKRYTAPSSPAASVSSSFAPAHARTTTVTDQVIEQMLSDNQRDQVIEHMRSSNQRDQVIEQMLSSNQRDTAPAFSTRPSNMPRVLPASSSAPAWAHSQQTAGLTHVTAVRPTRSLMPMYAP